MKLHEVIATTQPLPYKWIRSNKAVFLFKSRVFSIVLNAHEPVIIDNKKFNGLDVKFGVLRSEQAQGYLNTNLTNLGEPRTVIATVAHAVLDKLSAIANDKDFITIISKNEDLTSSRTKVYQAAIRDISDRVVHLGFKCEYLLHGAINDIILLSKHKLSPTDLDIFKNKFIA